MTTFLDGPANGHPLMLKVSPRFLRVTCEFGIWDALDQPGDAPRPAESLFAYELAESMGNCHIRASGGRSGFYRISSYRFIAEQPSDDAMRDNKLWKEWTDARETSK